MRLPVRFVNIILPKKGINTNNHLPTYVLTSESILGLNSGVVFEKKSHFGLKFWLSSKTSSLASSAGSLITFFSAVQLFSALVNLNIFKVTKKETKTPKHRHFSYSLTDPKICATLVDQRNFLELRKKMSLIPTKIISFSMSKIYKKIYSFSVRTTNKGRITIIWYCLLFVFWIFLPCRLELGASWAALP